MNSTSGARFLAARNESAFGVGGGGFQKGSKPHLVAVLQDDLGYADGALMHDGGSPLGRKAAPHLNSLVGSGIRLLHYTHYHCSPSRRSFLTGRSPHRAGGEELDNALDDSINLQWTTIAGKLNQAGYACHWYGKGHTGYKSMRHLPHGLGFTAGSAVNIHGIAMYHCTDRNDPQKVACGQMFEGTRSVRRGEYSTEYYAKKAVQAVRAHNPRVPLFMYLPWQSVHEPYEPPPSINCAFVNKHGQCMSSRPKKPSLVCPSSNGRGAVYRNGKQEEGEGAYENGCIYLAMLRFTDQKMSQITDALKQKGMWHKTLLLYTSDNGAPVLNGNNWPLRGRKYSNFEGALRVAAFLSGGFIPETLRGSKSKVALHIMDWYPTFCALAGVSASDGHAGLPSIDGVDAAPFLAQPAKRGRGAAHAELFLSEGAILIDGTYKYISHQPDGVGIDEDKLAWGAGVDDGRFMFMASPNKYVEFVKFGKARTKGSPKDDCRCCDVKGREKHGGCLFNVATDESETFDLSQSRPSMLQRARAALQRHNQRKFSRASPPALLGNCDGRCAKKHWFPAFGPTCGVPGCGSQGGSKGNGRGSIGKQRGSNGKQRGSNGKQRGSNGKQRGTGNTLLPADGPGVYNASWGNA